MIPSRGFRAEFFPWFIGRTSDRRARVLAHRAPAPTGFDAAASQEPFVDDIERALAPGRVSRGARPGGAVARDSRSLGLRACPPVDRAQGATGGGVGAGARGSSPRAVRSSPTSRPYPSPRSFASLARRIARGAPDPRARDVTRPRSHPSDVIVAPQTTLSIGNLTEPPPPPPLSLSRSVTTPKARGNLQVVAGVTKKPDLSDPVLRAKLAKGMGHNYYGEPAWPNDLLYIFPVVILGTIACVVGLAVMEPTQLGEPADPFATPLEILPEWYFFPTFNALRVIPNKLLGVLSMAAVPVGLITVPFLESINKFQNPFRRPVATSVFLIGTFYAIWMGIGATMPIDKAISLGVF